jgi:hypothetical protein
MKRWYDGKVWLFSLLLVLAGVATPVWAQTPSPTLANFLQSRNWWEDAGTTSSTRPFGIVYLFKGVSQGNGFYSGERVAVSGFPEFGRRLGIAYYPFEFQGHYGVYVDRGYGSEYLWVVGYDQQSEVLQVYGKNAIGGMSVFRWSSTRSPYTPAKIRELYLK